MYSAREIYQRTKKSPDLWWNLYVCRPVAALVVQVLQDRRITPNQITLASFFVALGSDVILLLWAGPLGLAMGVLALESAYVLDCADGMLARLRGIASPAGHLLDFLMDELKAFVLLGVVAIRLYSAYGDARWLLLGIVGLVALSTGIGITTFQRRPEIKSALAPTTTHGPQALPQRKSPARIVLGWTEKLAKLLIHYPSYIWLPAVLGHMELFLWPYVVINGLYAMRSVAWVALRFGR
jgi:phosphatidylglycerophosphate synthase